VTKKGEANDSQAGQQPLRQISRFQLQQGKLQQTHDQISVEEPLQLTLQHRDQSPIDLTVTMRTPGNDRELAAGFLFSEGIIKSPQDIESCRYDDSQNNQHNHLVITLAESLDFDSQRLQRNFLTHSSCGVCGKTAIQALDMLHQPTLTPDSPQLSSEQLRCLPEQLAQYQEQFAITGGVHSAALVNPQGEILQAWEDVGRHNAMDKLLGHLLLENQLPQPDNIVLLSGRLSFELVQKALMADIPMLAAIGAPTSLAVDLATRHNMTLVGFLKAKSFNIYTGEERIVS